MTASQIQQDLEALEALWRERLAHSPLYYTYRTTVAPMGGRFYVPLSAENRAGAGVAAGQTVDVDEKTLTSLKAGKRTH